MKSLREPYDIDIPLKSSPLTAEELLMVRNYIAMTNHRKMALEKQRVNSSATKINPEKGK